MWLWAWFTGGGWILMAGGAVVLGLVAAAVVVGATARKRAYARDAGKPNGARHVLAVVEEAPKQDFYGSMDLTEERDWRGYTHPMGDGWLPAVSEPTAAEVAASRAAHGYIPELDSDVQPDPYIDAIAAEHVTEFDPYDSGPGLPSLVPPGPDQAREEGAVGLVASQQGIGVDAAAGNASAQWQPEMTPVAALLLPPGPDWLDRQLAAHVAWVARMAPIVTGWSVAA